MTQSRGMSLSRHWSCILASYKEAHYQLISFYLIHLVPAAAAGICLKANILWNNGVGCSTTFHYCLHPNIVITLLRNYIFEFPSQKWGETANTGRIFQRVTQLVSTKTIALFIFSFLQATETPGMWRMFANGGFLNQHKAYSVHTGRAERGVVFLFFH